MERWQTAGFGLYIHWPFCASKCPYCDFNSHVSGFVEEAIWKEAYLAELRRMRDETGPRTLSSIFFGGGTPSLMSASLVGAVIDAATSLWSPANDLETTLEANPSSVEAGKFRDFRTAGVNRVSIGVQALDDRSLRRLGRLHDTAEALSAIDIASRTFDRFSFDLIYARQHQTAANWEAELLLAMTLGASHLSLYQLTIEPDTVFGARNARNQLGGLPSDDLGADMYDLTQAICRDHGLPAYEISNHCRPGQESRHNLIYWRSGDFAAIGPGAHGRLTRTDGFRRAFEHQKMPVGWLKQVQEAGSGESQTHILTKLEIAEEFLVMGLRLADGISLNELRTLTGHRITEKSLSNLEDLGMVQRTDGRLTATEKGRIVLNAVLSNLDLAQDAEETMP